MRTYRPMIAKGYQNKYRNTTIENRLCILISNLVHRVINLIAKNNITSERRLTF